MSSNNEVLQLRRAFAENPSEWHPLYDFLVENGDPEGAEEVRREGSTLPELRGCDWRQAFGYAGLSGQCGQRLPERALPNDTDTSVDPIAPWDVKRIIASSDGENDERDWLVVGELHDARFFALSAGCDYTGWDCRANGVAVVAACEEEIIRFGLSASERERLKLS